MSKAAQQKFVYRFGGGTAEGDQTMKAYLGGKGANLAEMCKIGIPVPPGITVSALACTKFGDKLLRKAVEAEIREGMTHLEALTKKSLGNPQNPLLVSVRSGAAVSMPGMMDTVLNLGINDEVTAGIARLSGNERFAWDLYRRFIDMFGDVVMGVDHEHFEHALAAMKAKRGVAQDLDLNTADLQELAQQYKEIFAQHAGRPLPTDPWEQLMLAVKAVFDSWNSERAVKYRRINKIEGLLGTAVTIQTMVYGNRGPTSGTGVLFTRNPSTGEKKLYGEYLMNAQGEDVVAGIRTPVDISHLEQENPRVFQQLLHDINLIEAHYKNMQDIEFTVEEGELYILQTRSGKRNGLAALHIAMDMVKEGLVTQKEAVRDLVQPEHLDQLLHPQFSETSNQGLQVLAKGLPASPGAAVGQVVFHPEEAEAAFEKGQKVILVRNETSPEDVGGMHAAQGILTTRGGMTSHAAVVARGWGKCCVSGCEVLQADYAKGQVTMNGEVVFKKGDWIALNGSTGEVILGKPELVEPSFGGIFAEFMQWVGPYQTIKVRANADTPGDATRAVEFGAEGIGLCRTEHMFFQPSRLEVFREMIMAQTKAERQTALDRLKPLQKEDFRGILQAMGERPVTIRLLDPPLHEFLPTEAADQEEMAKLMGITVEAIRHRIEGLKEVNPMLGMRGCRLGIIYPEITCMQVAAILEAALELQDEGLVTRPEIMIPLVSDPLELKNQCDWAVQTANELFHAKGKRVEYLLGCMIETPRAALKAGELAEIGQFCSFGTNDLTQMTYGFSRDDITKFLPGYIERRILPQDPFQVLDQSGVGELIRIAVDRGRHANHALKLGICGEHGGEPKSVAFCVKAGLNYVSCSPFRVPLARLAAAQAALAME